ncbi:MAG: hypothetical protein DWQ34_11725 [Planctomycetota bacterium]|nr:MAG: hypothetical protein DWQ29_07745 [Planctomycetota bacterium]REJ93129.1 MAG: hypothetical protein DWQ34_11725 [Planctomycetota bacterium]REK30118.1 MAG: hypothetical protein DWQ41_03030 [Planctomycetota bacterium]REK37639.1 MAG: hypothetical protein DWQ45_06495 [Planctomycetota bacterium]
MPHATPRFLLTRTAGLLVLIAIYQAVVQSPGAAPQAQPRAAPDLTSVEGGSQDATDILQAWIDSARPRGGELTFPAGTYRLTRPLEVMLDEVGPVSISAAGVTRLVMDGPGPAIHLVGTHGGTASPDTVQPNVWQNQRMPLVDGIEVIGRHPEACGIELTGTMQPTITRVTVRDALHGIHITQRNRNVQISDCHIYDNHGAGIFLDGVNLHQINIVGCHVSYNDGGGIVVRGSEVRNLQIGTCDIEGNMGGPDSEPTANIWLDSTGASIAEVAIVGCTIQHSHDAPGSANIRFNGESTPRDFTDETRHGYVTIADNVLSDVQVNIEIKNAIGVTITGNTVWKGYEHNLVIDNCEGVVVSNNAFHRNPRYHYGDGADSKLGVLIRNSTEGILSSNVIKGARDDRAALTLENCRWFTISDCLLLDNDHCGLLLQNCESVNVTGCMVRDEREGADSVGMRVTGGENVVVENNLVENGIE